MKHVLTFAIASLIVAFWSDKYDGLNIYKLHNRNYKNLIKKIKA
jgi:hypothetical protein